MDGVNVVDDVQNEIVMEKFVNITMFKINNNTIRAITTYFLHTDTGIGINSWHNFLLLIMNRNIPND